MLWKKVGDEDIREAVRASVVKMSLSFHLEAKMNLRVFLECFFSTLSWNLLKEKTEIQGFPRPLLFFIFFYISKLFFANSVAHCWMTVENAFQEKIQVTSMQLNFSQWDCTTLLQLNHCPDCAENHSEDQSEEVELSLSLRKASRVQNASGTRCIDFKPTQTKHSYKYQISLQSLFNFCSQLKSI